MQRVHAAKVYVDEQREWTRISQRARPLRPQRRWTTHHCRRATVARFILFGRAARSGV